jgi:putative transposase
MDLGEHLTQFRVLVRNRAGQFAASFGAVLADVGIRVVRIPPCCPRANCFAKRFVLTIRAEVSDRMLNQRHLRMVRTNYVQHYNGRRPHRARELRPSKPTHPVANLSYERDQASPGSGWLDQRVRTSVIKPLLSVGVDFWNPTGSNRRPSDFQESG